MIARKLGIAGMVVGGVLVAGSYAWSSWAVPQLVKYPTDVDQAVHYTGTVTLYVDPVTKAPLETAKVFPLDVTRQVTTVAGESTADTTMLREFDELTATGLFTGTQDHQYVIDRTTMQNVHDDRAYSFVPGNRVERAGTFRVAYPFDTGTAPMPLYAPETDTTVTLENIGTGYAAGLDVEQFQATLPWSPVSPAYFAFLNSLTPLPTQLTMDEMKPILKASGVDVDALLPALLPSLSPDDAVTLMGLAQQPVGLQYVFTSTGISSIEPQTGSLVDVPTISEQVGAVPDPTVLPVLRSILAKYPQVPEAVTAIAGLDQLAAAPIVMFENQYAQTAASVADVAATVQDAKDQMDLAEQTIPDTLRVVGLALIGLGLLVVVLATFAHWRHEEQFRKEHRIPKRLTSEHIPHTPNPSWDEDRETTPV